MKKEERYNNIWKYILLTVGSILILIPLLATVFSSFKSTKDIMGHFFAFPNPATMANYTRYLQMVSVIISGIQPLSRFYQ